MLPLANIFNGPGMIWVIVLVILLFGAKKLPEIGKSMAEGISEFKKAARKAAEDDTKDEKDTSKSE